MPAADESIQVGFLTVNCDKGRYTGGYLVTNHWGRPLEFRHSSEVQPTRAQELLYGETLNPFICAELIGKTLVEKSTCKVGLLVADNVDSLQMKRWVDRPVVLVVPRDDTYSCHDVNSAIGMSNVWLHLHEDYPQDETEVRRVVAQLGSSFDLLEPFERIRLVLNDVAQPGMQRQAA